MNKTKQKKWSGPYNTKALLPPCSAETHTWSFHIRADILLKCHRSPRVEWF